MKAQEFFELTGKVRAAQKKYFTGGRLHGDLVASKQLEAELDRALKAGLDVEPTAEAAVQEEFPAMFVEESSEDTYAEDSNE